MIYRIDRNPQNRSADPPGRHGARSAPPQRTQEPMAPFSFLRSSYFLNLFFAKFRDKPDDFPRFCRVRETPGLSRRVTIYFA
jgi:hypothetical protein